MDMNSLGTWGLVKEANLLRQRSARVLAKMPGCSFAKVRVSY